MKVVANLINELTEDQVDSLVANEVIAFKVGSEKITVSLDEVQIFSESTEDLAMTQDGIITVALDMSIGEELRAEGIAREVINRIQSMRKNADFNLTDRIAIEYTADAKVNNAVQLHLNTIKKETLARSMLEKEQPGGVLVTKFEIGSISIEIGITLEDTC